jgi:hypothetical protein
VREHLKPRGFDVAGSGSARARGSSSCSRRQTYLIAALRPLDDKQQEEAAKRVVSNFADDPHVTLGGNPVANEEISKTIEADLRRAELLAVPLIVLLELRHLLEHRSELCAGHWFPRSLTSASPSGVRE